MDITNPYDFEKRYVHCVYQHIAEEFSDTRYKVWNPVQLFLNQIQENSYVLEVGCGNGKNLRYLSKVENKIGCDICEKFVEMNKSQGIDCVLANGIKLPFPDNHFDYTFSVAVIHHLCTEDRRIKAIEEMIRVTKPGGKIFIEVWALDQPEYKRRKFTEQDTMVSWKNKQNRYYHVFKKGELHRLVSMFNVTILETKYDEGNWIVIFQV